MRTGAPSGTRTQAARERVASTLPRRAYDVEAWPTFLPGE